MVKIYDHLTREYCRTRAVPRQDFSGMESVDMRKHAETPQSDS